VGGLPHGNWFVLAKVVDKDTILVKKTINTTANYSLLTANSPFAFSAPWSLKP
jgi:hypothetical protein